MTAVSVRRHIRHRPAPALMTPWVKRRAPSPPGSLGAVIDDVVEGRRSGYTWTGEWKFDVNDPATMKRVYDKLGNREMFVVARTNLTLAQREREMFTGADLRGDRGVGLWRDDDGIIYMDDIQVLVGAELSEAMSIASNWNQRYLLRVDGHTRSFEFMEVR